MEENIENVPRLLLKPKKSTTPNVYMKSSNERIPQFTIRVTDFSQNVPSAHKQLSNKIISNDVSHSITKSESREHAFSVSPVNESSPEKKKIKMSEEIPLKRVVLVLPNKPLITSKSNADKENVKLIHDSVNKNNAKFIMQTKLNQTMMEISNKMNEDDAIESTYSMTNINTDQEKLKTQVSDMSFQNNNTHDSIASSAVIKNSSTKINNNSLQESRLNTSTSKSQTNSSKIMRIKQLNNSKLSPAQNLLATKKSMQINVNTPSPSVSQKQPSIKYCDKTPASKMIVAALSSPSSSSSSSSTETKIFATDGISPNLSMRQIKISGLKLKPINPGILNNLRLKNRIQICNRSVDKKSLLLPTEISESLVTTTVESPHKINQTRNNCEECLRLHSEVNEQIQTIMNLKRDLVESMTKTSKICNLSHKIDHRTEDERHSEILNELNDMNKQLRNELKRERFYNNKLKIGLSNRDRHIKELEYELAHISRLFDEIGVKAVSLKKFFNGQSS